ncbi:MULTISPECIES: hypothetical protein [Pectobacterium]|uniref:hypothetical protein n=1 Tax=Pectobacterium TaxID=122277 RepID=UPI001CF292C1|nr:hypothetical protein [Pectobacterium polaris]MCA6941836.1 hypothetical protein [Pectobacterium polaris]MCA6957680.1 hypothetical protein [Pectobacterium polaris]
MGNDLNARLWQEVERTGCGMAISGFVCLKTGQWSELRECPDWRGSYVTVAVCRQFCKLTGASMAGYASNFELAAQPQLRLVPAINEGRKKAALVTYRNYST